MTDSDDDSASGRQPPALETALERNRAYVRSRSAQPLAPPGTLRLAVVACYDPRLDALLLPALGLQPGEAFLLRTAGAFVQSGSTALRSLAMAVYMFGVTEVLIVGHTACRMASFETAAFIDAFRRRGVRRDAFGTEDLRAWTGAIPSPQRGVELSAANILAAPFFPADLRVGGLVLDETTGALQPVALGRSAAAQVAAPEPEVAAATPAPAAAVLPAPPAEGLEAAVQGLGETLQAERRWRAEIVRLRDELARTSSAAIKLRSIESFARRASAESSELRVAFERIRRASQGGGPELPARELLRLVERLARAR